MSIIDTAVNKLSAIAKKEPVDWNTFDAVLNGLENINIRSDETILSELLMYGEFFGRGEVLVDIVHHFLDCGYDVSANDGRNGLLALQALCWSSYDHKILDAAKALMNAGAPVCCGSKDDDSEEESEDLLGSIDWKISGAWMVDKNFGFANTLEAYDAMTRAKIAGKDYNSIDTYFACIGDRLTAVSAIKDGDMPTLKKEGAISVFSEPLVLWFGDKPLIANCHTDYIVNPVFTDDKKDVLTDVSSAFSCLIGATLEEVQYIGTTICFFEFSNGMRLLFASRDVGDRKRVGTFEIRSADEAVNAEHLEIESICAISGVTYASTVTDYNEDALALFCKNGVFLLYLRASTTARHQLRLCPCSETLITEYTRQYPLKRPKRTTWMYKQNELAAARLDYAEGHLYLAATEYCEIEIQLSEKLYDPLEYPILPRLEGKHMEFIKRQEHN